jgi:hypothetical protein
MESARYYRKGSLRWGLFHLEGPSLWCRVSCLYGVSAETPP